MVQHYLPFRPSRAHPSRAILSTPAGLRKGASRGFTLIELIVVTAIIVVVTSIVLVNNARFGGVVQLENLTYDVGLSIRQAQVYGISVQRFGAQFSAAYGMHFDINDPLHYELFADAAGTGIYDVSENVSPSPYAIQNGYSISGLCAIAPSPATICDPVSRIDILFKRPEPDAWIGTNDESCTADTTKCQQEAHVTLRSPRGDTMYVAVQANGQISVKR